MCPVCGRRARLAQRGAVPENPNRDRILYYECANGHQWTRGGQLITPDPRHHDPVPARRSFGLGARRSDPV